MKNVKENKREKTFTVQTTKGITRVFKTRRGAENHARREAKTIQIPMIVTANTYFWTSGSNASSRRYNENRRNAEIESFASEFNSIPTIRVEGEYSETCKIQAYGVRHLEKWRVEINQPHRPDRRSGPLGYHTH